MNRRDFLKGMVAGVAYLVPVARIHDETQYAVLVHHDWSLFDKIADELVAEFNGRKEALFPTATEVIIIAREEERLCLVEREKGLRELTKFLNEPQPTNKRERKRWRSLKWAEELRKRRNYL